MCMCINYQSISKQGYESVEVFESFWYILVGNKKYRGLMTAAAR